MSRRSPAAWGSSASAASWTKSTTPPARRHGPDHDEAQEAGEGEVLRAVLSAELSAGGRRVSSLRTQHSALRTDEVTESYARYGKTGRSKMSWHGRSPCYRTCRTGDLARAAGRKPREAAYRGSLKTTSRLVPAARKDGDAVVVAVRGEVDLNNSPELRTELFVILQKHAPAASSSTWRKSPTWTAKAVAVLVETLQKVRKTGGKVYLMNLQPRVQGLIEIARLGTISSCAMKPSAREEGGGGGWRVEREGNLLTLHLHAPPNPMNLTRPISAIGRRDRPARVRRRPGLPAARHRRRHPRPALPRPADGVAQPVRPDGPRRRPQHPDRLAGAVLDRRHPRLPDRPRPQELRRSSTAWPTSSRWPSSASWGRW